MQIGQATEHCLAARRIAKSEGSFRLRVLLDMTLLELREAISQAAVGETGATHSLAAEPSETIQSAVTSEPDASDANHVADEPSTEPLGRIFDMLTLASRFAETDEDAKTRFVIHEALALVSDRLMQRLDASREA